MNTYRGYYSILQFCPDPARFEVANSGAALLCPEQNYLAARVGGGNERVTRLFDRSQYDIERLNAYKLGLIDRVNKGGEITDNYNFTHFAAMQINAIVMTPPQYCRVEGRASGVLDKMFDELVGDKKRKPADGGAEETTAICV